MKRLIVSFTRDAGSTINTSEMATCENKLLWKLLKCVLIAALTHFVNIHHLSGHLETVRKPK